MITRALAALLLLFATGCLPPDRGWQARFPLPPATDRIAAELPGLREEARRLVVPCVEAIEDRLGKSWPRDPRGGVAGLELRVVPTAEVERDPLCGTRPVACTKGSGSFVEISLSAEPFLSGLADLEHTVCHELVHGYFRRHLSFRYGALMPAWAREGSAVYLAGQSDSKMLRQLFQRLENLEEAVDGLESSDDHGDEDYFESAAAFDFIDHPEPGVSWRRADLVLQRILEGRSIFTAIREYTGWGEESFRRQAREHALNRLRAARAELAPELLEAIRIRRDPGRWNDATALLEQVLIRSGLDPKAPAGGEESWPEAMTPSSAYSLYLWATIQAPFQKERAARAFRFLLRRVPSYLYGAEVAAVRYGLAGVLRELGSHDEALEQYSRVYLLHSENLNLQRASVAGLIRTFYSQGDYAQALRWVQAEGVRDDFESSSGADDELRLIRAVSLYETCQTRDGLHELGRLAAGPPRRVAVVQANQILNAIREGKRPAPRCP